jgi:peptidylprolyl isomerase
MKSHEHDKECGCNECKDDKCADEKCSCSGCGDDCGCSDFGTPNPDAKIAKGSRVAIAYVGTLEDGEVFDKTEEGNPLMFTIGAGEILPVFEEAIIGLKMGDEKEIHLEPKDAYGDKNPNLMQEVPKNLVEGKIELEKGKKIMFSTPDGHKAYAEIVYFSGESVRLDFNHPLAGKSLNFHIKVLEVR